MPISTSANVARARDGFMRMICIIVRKQRAEGYQIQTVSTPVVQMRVAVHRPSTSSTPFAAPGPVTGTHLPLIVLSHGQQGALGSHADTAVALAEAGFVVAAPQHAGDNVEDQSAVGGPRWFSGRTREVAAAIDYLLTSWPAHGAIDAGRIGIFGFSAGGTTALIAIGGVPDLAGIPAHCRAHPKFACQLWTGGAPAPLIREPRLKAAVIAAPGFGFAFLPDGLKGVTVPVQLWSGAADTHVPAASNVAPLAKVLAGSEYRSVSGAEHFSFLAPCQGPPICTAPPGFERNTFHHAFNARWCGSSGKS